MKHLVGAGHVAERIIKNSIFGHEYCLYDNNLNMVGTNMLGITIETPESIKGRDGDIIICTTSVGEVTSQLQNFQITNEIIFAPEIQEFQSHGKLDQYSGKFLVASGLPSNNLRGASGGLFLVEVTPENTAIKEIMGGSCHGVVRSGKGYAVSHQEKGIILLTDEFEIKSIYELPGNSRSHGLAYDKDNIWTVCSNRDSIVGINPNGKIFKEISISDKFKLAGTAQHHMNDLEIIDGNAFISMFSLSGEWKNGVFDGGVMRVSLDDESKENIVTGLSLPHSVRKLDRTFVVMDSFNGKLFSFNKEPEYTFNGFLRGFDFDNSYFYFGESRNRNSTGLMPPKFPVSVDTNIQIVDRKYGYSKAIAFPPSLSEIHSILAIQG